MWGNRPQARGPPGKQLLSHPRAKAPSPSWAGSERHERRLLARQEERLEKSPTLGSQAHPARLLTPGVSVVMWGRQSSGAAGLCCLLEPSTGFTPPSLGTSFLNGISAFGKWAGLTGFLNYVKMEAPVHTPRRNGIVRCRVRGSRPAWGSESRSFSGRGWVTVVSCPSNSLKPRRTPLSPFEERLAPAAVSAQSPWTPGDPGRPLQRLLLRPLIRET